MESKHFLKSTAIRTAAWSSLYRRAMISMSFLIIRLINLPGMYPDCCSPITTLKYTFSLFVITLVIIL